MKEKIITTDSIKKIAITNNLMRSLTEMCDGDKRIKYNRELRDYIFDSLGHFRDKAIAALHESKLNSFNEWKKNVLEIDESDNRITSIVLALEEKEIEPEEQLPINDKDTLLCYRNSDCEFTIAIDVRTNVPLTLNIIKV